MEATFKDRISLISQSFLKRPVLEILQVNLGNMCNQSCRHCHVRANTDEEIIMGRRVMDEVIRFLAKNRGLSVDVTGGSPELNPDFRYFIEKAAGFSRLITVRNNLTVLFEPGAEGLPEFFRKHSIKLICSLPCYTKENVDRQRGEGVFEKSIAGLKTLNDTGYGKEKGLELDLVYNPAGAFLPASQDLLETDYRANLAKFGITFNRLIAMTNAPINRFRQYLEANGELGGYMELLAGSFNPDAAANIMCRNLLSVGWEGKIYDCDFNQALALSIHDAQGRAMNISGLEIKDIEGKEIRFEEHCYCCTAGAGSSCSGALT